MATPVAAVPGQPLRLFGSVTAPAPDVAVVVSTPGVSCVKAVAAGGGEYVVNVPADDPDTSSKKEGAVAGDLLSVFVDPAEPSTIMMPSGGGFQELLVVASTSQLLALDMSVFPNGQIFTVAGTVTDGSAGASVSGATVNLNWGDGTDCGQATSDATTGGFSLQHTYATPDPFTLTTAVYKAGFASALDARSTPSPTPAPPPPPPGGSSPPPSGGGSQPTSTPVPPPPAPLQIVPTPTPLAAATILEGGEEAGVALAEAAESDVEAASAALIEAAQEDPQAAGAALAVAAEINAEAVGVALAIAAEGDPDSVGAALAVAVLENAAAIGLSIAAAAVENAEATGNALAVAAATDAAAIGSALVTAADADAVATGNAVAAAAAADAQATGNALAAAARADTQATGNALAAAAAADPDATGSAVAFAAVADAAATGNALAAAAATDPEATGNALAASAATDASAAGDALTSSARRNAAATGNALRFSAGRDASATGDALATGPARDSDALAALGEVIPVEPWVPEEAPVPGSDPTGEGEWQSVGSPAPIERILERLPRTFPSARVIVSDVIELPGGVPPLPAGRVVNSYLTLSAENFESQDIFTAHVALFVEKSWLDANQVHQWSVQFSRFNEEQEAWRPAPAKRLREDEERVFYSVVVPAFSLWSISGSVDVPDVRFRVKDLTITPAQPQEGQSVTIRAQIANLTDEAAEFYATLWLNSQANATQGVLIPPGATVPVAFTVRPKAGSYDVRIDRLLGGFNVQAAPTPTVTVTPTPTRTATPVPTREPTATPTFSPTPAITATPTTGLEPSATPSQVPSATPTAFSRPTTRSSPAPAAAPSATEGPAATPVSPTPLALPAPTPPPAPPAAEQEAAGGGLIAVTVGILVILLGLGTAAFVIYRYRRGDLRDLLVQARATLERLARRSR